jgi:Arf-GAP/SH3 domain/ANK repeat/PH domain-containing protein
MTMSLFISSQMQSLDSMVLYPVDRLLKGDLRGSKGDLKRPFERAFKDYQDKFAELERQKKKAAKDAGECGNDPIGLPFVNASL